MSAYLRPDMQINKMSSMNISLLDSLSRGSGAYLSLWFKMFPDRSQ